MMMPPRLRSRSWRAMRLRRLEVGLEDGVVEVARADEAAGVDVDRGQRLGLVDDQVAARLQVDAARQRARDLFLDVEEVEDRPLAVVVLELAHRAGHVGRRRTSRSASNCSLRVDADRLRGVVGQVAQHALGQVQVLVQQRAGAAAGGRARGSSPRPCAGRRCRRPARSSLASSALVRRMKPPPPSPDQRLHARAQLLAQLGRADLLRDADVVVLRQEHQHAAGDLICVDSRAPLVPIGSLITCTSQRLALRTPGARSAPAARRSMRAPLLLCRSATCRKAARSRPMSMKAALHARQHARDLAEVDVADQPALERALDVQLLHGAVLDDGHARFLRRPVDQDVMAGHGAKSKRRLHRGSARSSRRLAATAAPSRTAAGP